VVDLPLLAWNEKLNTVHPSSVNVFVKENIIAGEEKIVAHYLQLHAPFLTRTWFNITNIRLISRNGAKNQWDSMRWLENFQVSERKSFWKLLEPIPSHCGMEKSAKLYSLHRFSSRAYKHKLLFIVNLSVFPDFIEKLWKFSKKILLHLEFKAIL